MPEIQLKDPVRQVNQEFLAGLEVLSNKEFPLPGALCKGGDIDPRHTHLDKSKEAEVTLFTHLATLRHRSTNSTFVIFRKTMDALLLEQTDKSKYPSWLMDSSVKKTELSTYIHIVKPPYSQNPLLVVRDRNIVEPTRQTRIDKWLSEISIEWVFDTVAYFALKNKIFNEEMYVNIR